MRIRVGKHLANELFANEFDRLPENADNHAILLYGLLQRRRRLESGFSLDDGTVEELDALISECDHRVYMFSPDEGSHNELDKPVYYGLQRNLEKMRKQRQSV